MRIIDLGLTDFSDAYRFQLELLDKVSSGACEDTLLITEHNPVITIGRKGKEGNILRPREFLASRGIDVFNIDRKAMISSPLLYAKAYKSYLFFFNPQAP